MIKKKPSMVRVEDLTRRQSRRELFSTIKAFAEIGAVIFTANWFIEQIPDQVIESGYVTKEIYLGRVRIIPGVSVRTTPEARIDDSNIIDWIMIGDVNGVDIKPPLGLGRERIFWVTNPEIVKGTNPDKSQSGVNDRWLKLTVKRAFPLFDPDKRYLREVFLSNSNQTQDYVDLSFDNGKFSEVKEKNTSGFALQNGRILRPQEVGVVTLDS